MARIPMRGRVASLNASVAGSVFLFEAATQRSADPPPPVPLATESDDPADDEANQPDPGPSADADPAREPAAPAEPAEPAEPASEPALATDGDTPPTADPPPGDTPPTGHDDDALLPA
jgi:hypothetical protein